MKTDETRPGDPLWYKDAVIYELHVRSFADSDGDGIGDFPGLIAKLDYLQGLGVTALWILPFYPSPLKDDGYDIADYREVNPAYGKLADFRLFLREAHARGLKVITELVINHTSDQHPWFQRARRAKPGSTYRDFYVWSDDPTKYSEARIIFKDFESSNWTWDPVAEAYFWHRFYHHQPDLNFESPQVRREVVKALDYWFDMGVDGLRLDAIPYLYERQGTDCENLPETHEFLKELRAHVDEKYEGRMLLAEANQWPEDTLEYFGDGDECHMAFHFPLMPRLFMALRMEDRFPILDIMEQTPAIPESSQWAIFLRNHDELTLEMVTDEDRDYMYRVYASDPRARINLGIRRRLAPLLGNDRRRVELMTALLLSMPGTPVLYYGDEIGMGDNIYLGDRNGVRTPMQWSPDRNAGFSRANPQRLFLPVVTDPEYHYEAVNVEAQEGNPHSLLWWTKRIIALRKRYPTFGRGDLEFLTPSNPKCLAFLRSGDEETILVVANLSRFPQHVELDLGRFDGRRPRELFGRTAFPRIGELPYLLTLGPHAFYWFDLEGREETEETSQIPALRIGGTRWAEELRGRTGDRLTKLLPRILPGKRWFAGKARTIRESGIRFVLPVGRTRSGPRSFLVLVDVEYTEGEPESYVLSLTFARGSTGRLLRDHPEALLARLVDDDGEEAGVLHDAVFDEDFRRDLLGVVERGRRRTGDGASLAGVKTPAFGRLRGEGESLSRVSRAEQSNTSIFYDERLVLKLVRKVEPGPHPDEELGRFLTEKAGFETVPEVAGTLVIEPEKGEAITVAVIQEFVAHETDGWKYALDSLERYFERAVARRDIPLPKGAFGHPLELVGREPPEEVAERIGPFRAAAADLGGITAALHRALGSAVEDPGLVPERFGTGYQRSLYQSMRSSAGRCFRLLESKLDELPDEARGPVEELLAARPTLLDRYGELLDRKLDARRIRIHGDYHLGQVLWTGETFVVTDFEGEPGRSLSARRIKRSPLRDVAGMVRSFHYAARSALESAREHGLLGPEDEPGDAWAEAWYAWSSATFLDAYLEGVSGTGLVPEAPDDLRLLLDAFLLDKVIYELGYELSHRPRWITIPVAGLRRLLEAP